MVTQRPDPIDMDGEEMSVYSERRLPLANNGLKLINPARKDEDDYKEEFKKKRQPYSAMRAHMELAAQAIAAGGTQVMAAKYAGISKRQVHKYVKDADFRARVEEIRTLLVSKIRGKVIREIDRRTSPEVIQKMELLDLLRVGDRVGLGRGAVEAEKPSGSTSYDLILQQVFLDGRPSKGEAFPVYGPDIIPLPGSDTPSE